MSDTFNHECDAMDDFFRQLKDKDAKIERLTKALRVEEQINATGSGIIERLTKEMDGLKYELSRWKRS